MNAMKTTSKVSNNYLKRILFAALASMCLVATSQTPWEKGALEVSSNGHYIQHTNGSPFLWIADTGWGMVQQLTREEIDLYLDNRQKLGFT